MTTEEVNALSDLLGYVLIVHRKGFRSTEVHGRFSREIVEESARRVKQRDDVTRVVIEGAVSFQQRTERESDERRPHDDWGFQINGLQSPLMNTLPEFIAA